MDRQMMDPKNPRQQALVVQKQLLHSIHSLDSHRQLLQVTDPQVDPQAQDQIMALQLVLAPDQITDPDPQLVTQAHSDEASLILRPHRLVAHRDLQQIMLMEVLRQHHQYSVASLPRLLHRLMVRRVETHQPQVQTHRLAHLMVRLR